MEENKTAIDSAPVAAQPVVATTTAETVDDTEARYKQLEVEKENYKKAFLKEKAKNKQDENLDEDEDAKIERKVHEAIASSRLADIAREQDAIIQTALKENKELKLVARNKAGANPVAAIGTHTESTAVTDTMITPEQLDAFKKRGWSDKDIERYKKNLSRSR